MHITILVTFLYLSFFTCSEDLKIEGQNIVLKNQKIINTNLIDLKFHGQLAADSTKIYFVLSGRECTNCDENISIFIAILSDSLLIEKQKFYYPGKLYDLYTGELIYESRLFIGNCLPNKNNIAIWYQKYLNEKNIMIEDVFIVEATSDSIKSYSSINYDDINITLNMLKQNKCIEVLGITQNSEP